ncbi:MAG: ELM1/GtrOC1 family putative glycosyltransferase, partial [Pseudomonadota bacterium]
GGAAGDVATARPPRAAAPLALIAVTDGRAGNRAQALGLAEALARRRPAARAEIAERTVTLRPAAARLPPRFWALLAAPGWRGPLPWPEAGLDPGTRDLAMAPPSPGALLIGAGRRAGPVVAALAARHGLASVQLLGPQMAPCHFGLVAAPAHDGLTGDNVVATLGSVGRLTRTGIEAAASALPDAVRAALDALPRPRLALLLGGPSRSAGFAAADAEALATAVAAAAAGGWSVMVTPSRRSPPGLAARLAAACPPGRGWAWDGVDAATNPYPGMLGLADAVLVTEDSVNMASEAAASGLPVHVFRLALVSRKIRAFHRALAEHGASRPYDGALAAWSYAPLAEADRLAALVETRLLR